MVNLKSMTRRAESELRIYYLEPYHSRPFPSIFSRGVAPRVDAGVLNEKI